MARASETSRSEAPENLRARRAYEAGFRVWVEHGCPDVGAGTAQLALHRPTLEAVALAAGVTVEQAQSVIAGGVPRLSLPSYRERAREAARLLVARDEHGASPEAAETKTAEALLEQQERARAEVAARERQILGDAVEQRANEIRMVRGVWTVAGQMLNVQVPLIHASMKLAQDVQRAVQDGTAKVTPREALKLIRDVAYIVKTTAETARTAAVADKVLSGDHGALLNPGAPDIEMSPDEAGRYVAAAQRAFANKARHDAIAERERKAQESTSQPS